MTDSIELKRGEMQMAFDIVKMADPSTKELFSSVSPLYELAFRLIVEKLEDCLFITHGEEEE